MVLYNKNMSGKVILFKIIGIKDGENIEIQIYRIVAFFMVLLYLITLIANFFIFIFGPDIYVNTNYYDNLFFYTSGLVFAILFILSRFYNRHYPTFFLLTMSLALFAFWFVDNGISGSIPYFFILPMSTSVLLLSGIRLFLFQTFLISGMTLLVVLEYNYPEIVTFYPSRAIKYIDVYGGILMAFGFFTIIFWFVIYNYKRIQEDLSKKNALLKELAQKDSLTGLLNHGAIFRMLQREIERAKRYNTPLSIIMFDLDFFKKFNDENGHHMGDLLLVKVAKVFKENLRFVDIIGRYGGEEFLVILPGTPLREAYNVAEKIRKMIKTIKVEGVGGITISGGVATFKREKYKREKEYIELIKEADHLLYKAKEEGKDRIKIK